MWDFYGNNFLSHARALEALPQAARLAGCPHPSDYRPYLSPWDEICGCLSGKYRVLPTGGGLLNADVEVFLRIRDLLPATHTRAFVIGNAFGYSAMVLGLLIANTHEMGGAAGSVDVIDAEVEGECNRAGTFITRAVANASGVDIALTKGRSPEDVPLAMRSKTYDLAFLDGKHTVMQLSLDFAAVETVPVDVWQHGALRRGAFKTWLGQHSYIVDFPLAPFPISESNVWVAAKPWMLGECDRYLELYVLNQSRHLSYRSSYTRHLIVVSIK